MLIKRASGIKSSEITDQNLYLDRRRFITGTAALGAAALFGPVFGENSGVQGGKTLEITKKGEYTVADPLTPVEEATGYTNYYEFSTGKRSVKRLSKDLKTRPWTVTVDGLVEKNLKFNVDELIARFSLEERVYRWRCVEAWSMVIPWIGFPLADLIKLCQPTSRAGFVEFTTLYDPEQMPGLASKVLPWPYTEGLRMDEAMHPLTLMVVGMYGEVIPNQNGAPLRLVVPWKYGFKGCKSIVRMRFTERQPRTAWNKAKPEEYGFYANVNPNVDHPRWSQARERIIGGEGRRPTLMFNGYADQVGHLYSGMDLKKNY